MNPLLMPLVTILAIARVSLAAAEGPARCLRVEFDDKGQLTVTCEKAATLAVPATSQPAAPEANAPRLGLVPNATVTREADVYRINYDFSHPEAVADFAFGVVENGGMTIKPNRSASKSGKAFAAIVFQRRVRLPLTAEATSRGEAGDIGATLVWDTAGNRRHSVQVILSGSNLLIQDWPDNAFDKRRTKGARIQDAGATRLTQTIEKPRLPGENDVLVGFEEHSGKSLRLSGLSISGHVTARFGASFEAPNATVSAVLDGPAAAAGVMAGDKLVSIDNKAVATVALAVNALRRCAPGDTVTWRLRRAGKAIDLKVTAD